MKTVKTIDKPVLLGRASRDTLGANFGITERVGLQVPGVGLSER